MKFVLIFGPQAVGKMTVGQELEKMTGLKLFHNHMTIELVSPFFSYGTDEGKRLVNLFRREIFEAVSKSDLYGLIFTWVWAFDEKGDWDYVEDVCGLFESRGAEIYFVELKADLEERAARNKTPNRLANKPTKRDLEVSERRFYSMESKYRLNSYEGEITRKNYICIDNTSAAADAVAKQIKETFSL
ncbi:MAG: AAA family ATPase [Defluviitaleaceae bacterium]|nr:AAA family ATPase [Defluviitaleaceae bacterium]